MATYREHSVIHPEAKIGNDVFIGPFCYIDRDVEIGDGAWIGPHVTIFEGARIGKNVRIFPGATISGIPQDLKFKGEQTVTEIGDNSIIREYVTVNRGTAQANKTKVGSDCLLMAYVHVAHDCILGDHVILANNVNLAGHVLIDDWAIVEGQVGVQQFTRIGKHSFVGGGSLVRKDVPPFVRAAREPLTYIGVNNVGLKRRHYTTEQIHYIHDIYRVIFQQGHSLSNAIQLVETEFAASEERDAILDFIRQSEGGIVRGYRNPVNGANVYED